MTDLFVGARGKAHLVIVHNGDVGVVNVYGFDDVKAVREFVQDRMDKGCPPAHIIVAKNRRMRAAVSIAYGDEDPQAP